MLMDWKDQYHQNDYNIQGNPQIQHNTYQISNGIFHRIRIKKSGNLCGDRKELE